MFHPHSGDSLHCNPSDPSRSLARSLLFFAPIFFRVHNPALWLHPPAVRVSFQTKRIGAFRIFFFSLQQKLGKCRAQWALSQVPAPSPSCSQLLLLVAFFEQAGFFQLKSSSTCRVYRAKLKRRRNPSKEEHLEAGAEHPNSVPILTVRDCTGAGVVLCQTLPTARASSFWCD